MDQFLRVDNVVSKQVETILDFQHQDGIQQLAEKCSGSGDCRKTEITGGTMCPSYMATRSESDSTRARANMLRHYYSQDVNQLETNDELLEQTHSILDLCLSCKGCKTECPSGVDVGKMKAEFTQHYYERKGVSFRSKLLGRFVKNIERAYKVPWLYNGMINSGLGRILINRILGIHPNRSLPLLTTLSLRDWSKHRKSIKSAKKVYLFADEFTNYLDTEIGKKCILLLEALGYEVVIPEHLESARSYLSKGLLYEARQIAIENVSRLSKIISENTPLIGIEPSAILSFRDEYIDLVPQTLKADAKNLSVHTLLFEEWFDKEAELGRIKQEQFTSDTKLIRLHGHCHQKALSSMVPAKRALSFPKNYKAQLIPSGCCGMAGSFGYEKEHYDLSMNIGELVLFPTVRSVGDQVIVAANGTSCRHQIKDSTGKIALHPIEVLYDALITL
jgi:Fe-S oxidoreductase